jgi:hypothetical protein
MRYDKLKEPLTMLGLFPGEESLLMLLPLIYVARSNGAIAPPEQAKIEAIAQRIVDPGDHTREILRCWLEAPLTHRYIARGLEILRQLARAPDEPSVEPYDLNWLLVECEAMARAAAHWRGSPWQIDSGQREALEEVARILSVDHGSTWDEVLRELNTQRPRVTVPPSGEPLRGGIQPVEGEAPNRPLEERHLRRVAHPHRAYRALRTQLEDDEATEPSGGII